MPWTAHIDGGSRGNPGPAAAGVVIADETGQTVVAAGFFLGRTTNNQAEYQGLLHALRLFEKAGVRQIEIVSDSELMVRQINGQYKVRSPDLRPLYEEAMAALAGFQWRMRHTLREGNTGADAMANAAMDARRDVIEADSRGLVSEKSSSASAKAPAADRESKENARPDASPPAVQARVIRGPGSCPAGLEEGEIFEFASATPAGVCLHLCTAALPVILEMQAAGVSGERRIRCGRPGCGAILEVKLAR